MCNLAPLLNEQAEWLGHQAEFDRGWEEGCAWVETKMAESVEDSLVRLEIGERPHELVAACQVPVCAAFLYHWSRASRDPKQQLSGQQVLEKLERGIRPTTESTRMGGDPLRDLVLVSLIVRGYPCALQRFSREYRSLFNSEAQRTLGHVPVMAEWEDLCSGLALPRQAGLPETAPLSGYHGFGSLRTWLRPVARHFLTDVWRKLRIRRVAEQHYAEEGRSHIDHSGELIEPSVVDQLTKLNDLVHVALDQLSSDRRRLVIWEAAGLSNREIANVRGVSPGHASRLCHQALLALRDQLLQLLDRQPAEFFEGVNWLEKLRHLSPKEIRTFVRTLSELLASEEASHQAGSNMPTDTETHTAAPEMLLRREDFRAVTLTDDPDTIAQEGFDRDPDQRPIVVCLDAREAPNSAAVESWVERLDTMLLEPYEQFDEYDPDAKDQAAASVAQGALEPPVVYEPRRVVLATSHVYNAVHQALQKRSDITWVLDTQLVEPYDAYLLFLNQAIKRALQPRPRNPAPAPAPGQQPIGRLLPPGQTSEWERRMRQLKTWAQGGEAGATS